MVRVGACASAAREAARAGGEYSRTAAQLKHAVLEVLPLLGL